jgi:hypothetical protein
MRCKCSHLVNFHEDDLLPYFLRHFLVFFAKNILKMGLRRIGHCRKRRPIFRDIPGSVDDL